MRDVLYLTLAALLHCNTLHHAVAYCSTIQHTAARCNTLQHTGAHATRYLLYQFVCAASRIVEAFHSLLCLLNLCCFQSFSLVSICSGLMRPPWLGTKWADLLEISNTNLLFFVNQSFLVQEQNHKLVLPKLTKRQV